MNQGLASQGTAFKANDRMVGSAKKEPFVALDENRDRLPSERTQSNSPYA